MYAEAVSSDPNLIYATKSCGIVKPGQTFEIKVMAKPRALIHKTSESVSVALMIENARIIVPVKFV